MGAKLLCLEGITGAGKTSQTNRIRKIWNSSGNSYLTINEKEYEPFRQTIIDWHSYGTNQNFSREQAQNIARARGKTHKIHFIPRLNDLDYILFDRSFYTSAVYQSNERLSPEEIVNLNVVEGSLIPGRGVVLICSPETARKRIDQRRLKLKRYSLPSIHESISEIKKRRDLYLELTRQHPELCLIDTTDKTEDEVFEEVKGGLGL